MIGKTRSLPLTHLLLAVAVAGVWGTNFVVIKVALAHLPPLLFAALRFVLAFLPAAFFFKRPAVRWTNLAAYGVVIGAGQFGLLYIAMQNDISPGLASIVIQMQVFFTIGLAMWISSERLQRFQWLALLLAAAGLAMIALSGGASATPKGLVLVLLAAMAWASGNVLARSAGPVNVLGYVVWASVFSFPPLFVLSFLFEGWSAIRAGVAGSDWLTWAAVLYQSAGNTLFGYATWAWLLARHPAATISPIALLVPVFGMSTSALLLSEPMPAWKLIAAGLVMSGLALNLVWPVVVGRTKRYLTPDTNPRETP
jgi:O-acetylserine/cysteine efflux transporter